MSVFLKPVIAVVGPGAVGGLLAWLLHRSGADVVVVGRAESVARIASRGLRVTSTVFGQSTEFVPASERVPEGASVLLTVKAFGLDDSLKLISQSRPQDVLSLMNGVGHAELISRHLEHIPVAAGSIAVEATRAASGTIDHKSPFLRVAVPRTAREFGSVRAVAATGIDLSIDGTDAEVLWRKFRYLAPLALLTSYWQAPLGEALAKDGALTKGLLTEVVACEAANGVPDTVSSLAATLSGLPATMRSSLQADLAAGRRGELDWIGGELLRQGERHGLDVAVLEKVVARLSGSL